MKKFIFLTLVMIIGMSSVSFGKSYFCESEIGTSFKLRNDVWEIINLRGNKYIIRTSDGGEVINYFGWFGEDENLCPHNFFLNYLSKGSELEFLTCRSYSKQEGRTITEISLDTKRLRFQVFMTGHLLKHGLKVYGEIDRSVMGSLVEYGKCSEI